MKKITQLKLMHQEKDREEIDQLNSQIESVSAHKQSL